MSRWPGYPIYWKTEQKLFVRIKEHTKPTKSAVYIYIYIYNIEQCKFCQDHKSIFNCFKVIKFCKNQSILIAVEPTMIKKLNSNLIIN